MTDTEQRPPALSLRDLTASVPDGSDTRILLDHVDLDDRRRRGPGRHRPVGLRQVHCCAAPGLLRRPREGDVLIDGEPTAGLSERRRTRVRRARIGIIYQSASLLPSLTARAARTGRPHRPKTTGRDQGPGRSALATSVSRAGPTSCPGSLRRRAPTGRHRPKP
jgi:hypothetical protein